MFLLNMNPGPEPVQYVNLNQWNKITISCKITFIFSNVCKLHCKPSYPTDWRLPLRKETIKTLIIFQPNKVDKNIIFFQCIVVEEEEEVSDFLVEIEILSECRHKNIVQLYDVYFHNQHLWVGIVRLVVFCSKILCKLVGTVLNQPPPARPASPVTIALYRCCSSSAPVAQSTRSCSNSRNHLRSRRFSLSVTKSAKHCVFSTRLRWFIAIWRPATFCWRRTGQWNWVT